MTVRSADDLDTALAAGGDVTLPFGTWVLNRHVTIPTNVNTLNLNRSLIDLVDNGATTTPSVKVVRHPGLAIHNGSIQSRNATGRTATHGLLWVENSDNLHAERLWFGRSPSTAVWMMECHGFTLRSLTVTGTFADGIHISRGSRDGLIESCGIYNTGDDGIGVISYRKTGAATHEPCSNITIRGNTIRRARIGRGVAIAGSQNVTVEGNTIEVIDQCAVLVADFTNEGIRTDPASVTIINNTTSSTGLNTPPGGRGEAIYVSACTGGRVAANTSRGVSGAGVTITGTATGITTT